jgi:hypothetical protein
MKKVVASRNTVFLLGKDEKLLAPNQTRGRVQQTQSTPE